MSTTVKWNSYQQSHKRLLYLRTRIPAACRHVVGDGITIVAKRELDPTRFAVCETSSWIMSKQEKGSCIFDRRRFLKSFLISKVRLMGQQLEVLITWYSQNYAPWYRREMPFKNREKDKWRARPAVRLIDRTCWLLPACVWTLHQSILDQPLIIFTSTNHTRIFLDKMSIRNARVKLADEDTSRRQDISMLNQLKQVRSKSHHLSTYTMCRSSLPFPPPWNDKHCLFGP